MTWNELASYIQQHPEWGDADARIYDYECGVSGLADDMEFAEDIYDTSDDKQPFLTISRWFS